MERFTLNTDSTGNLTSITTSTKSAADTKKILRKFKAKATNTKETREFRKGCKLYESLGTGTAPKHIDVLASLIIEATERRILLELQELVDERLDDEYFDA